MRTLKTALFLAAVAPIALFGVPAAADETEDAAQALRLGIGDALSVTVFARPDLSGVFPIGAQGALRLPLLGRVQAAGMTLEEVETALQEQASDMLDYQAVVTVDAERFRPVLVIGDVVAPGEHLYRPDMTARTAFAMAGGRPSISQLPASVATGMATAERDLWRAQATHRSLLIRMAALDAMLSDTPELTLPRDLVPHRDAPTVIEQVARQNSVIDNERRHLAQTREMLNRQHDQLDQEIASLVQEGNSLQRQAALVDRELSNMQTLADRGLTTNSRMLDLRQMKETIEANTHRQAAALTRARQAQVRLEMTLADTLAAWRRELLDERFLISRDIQIARADLEGARNQLLALSDGSNAAATAMSGPEATQLRFVITRDGPDGPRDMRADPTTRMLPGDVLEVRAVPPVEDRELSALPGASTVAAR